MTLAWSAGRRRAGRRVSVFGPWIVGAALLFADGAAFALASPALVVADGTGIDVEQLQAQLAVELANGRSPVRIELSRSRDLVHARLVFGDGGVEDRDIALGDVAATEAPRVLALALAELSQAHTAVPPIAPKPAPAAPKPAPPAEAPAPVRAAPVTFGGEAAVGARGYTLAGTLALEPRIGIFLRHTSGARLDLAVVYQTAWASDAIGSVSFNAIGGALGLSYSHAILPGFFLRFGPRVDVLAAFGSGTATGLARATNEQAAVVGLVAEVAASVQFFRVLPLVVVIDGGGMVRGFELRADDRTPLAARGATFGARLGFAL